MARIRFILLIITLLVAKVGFAQLSFDSTQYDFGTIEEQGGKRSCTFRATNLGSKPVVLVDVVTTCGCTVPTFSRKPILAGQSTEIVVSYDPEGRPGAFDRKLHIYGANRERLGVLSIKGTVTPRPRSVEELYPIEVGEGVRLNTTHCTFTYIYVGRSIASAISLVNDSGEQHRLELRPKRSSGLLEVDYPTTLQPGERSAINFSYTIPTDAPRYGTVSDALEIWVDGVKSEKVLLTHGIAVDPPQKAAQERAPKAQLSENFLKFGAVKHDGALSERSLTIRNEGLSPLAIRAVECKAPFEVAEPKRRQLAPGEEVTLRVKLRPRDGEYGFVTGQLLLVTNDPERPLRRIRVNATIED